MLRVRPTAFLLHEIQKKMSCGSVNLIPENLLDSLRSQICELTGTAQVAPVTKDCMSLIIPI